MGDAGVLLDQGKVTASRCKATLWGGHGDGLARKVAFRRRKPTVCACKVSIRGAR